MTSSESSSQSGRHGPPHLAIVAAHAATTGGMERFARFVCRTMLEAGWRVTAALSGEDIYQGPRGRPADRLQIDRVNWLDETYAGDRRYRFSTIRDRRGWFARVRPQVALFIQSSNTPFRCAVAGAYLAGVRVVTTHRTLPWPLLEVPRSRYVGGLLPGIGLHDRLMRRKTWLTGALASAIVYNNESTRRSYEQTYGLPVSRGHVIPNAVEVGERRVSRSAPDTKKAGISIGYVGRLSREKRIDILLHAIAHLQTDRPVRVVIHGDGPERERLFRLRAELGLDSCVEFAGPTDRPEAVYPALDIVTLCSPRESSSNMILEAMAHGCAPIVTEAGGMPELVQQGRCGRVVPALNVAALRDVLDQLIADDAARIALGEAAMQRVEAFHGPQRVARLWTDLFEGIAGYQVTEHTPKRTEETIAAFAVHRV